MTTRQTNTLCLSIPYNDHIKVVCVLYDAVNLHPFHLKLRLISIKQTHAVWRLYAHKMIMFLLFSFNYILLHNIILILQNRIEIIISPVAKLPSTWSVLHRERTYVAHIEVMWIANHDTFSLLYEFSPLILTICGNVSNIFLSTVYVVHEYDKWCRNMPMQEKCACLYFRNATLAV